MKDVTVNICNAAEKIESYPENIQKLVWRALHYQCEIKTRRSEFLRSPQPTAKDNEKLTKYIEVFRRTQQMIIKMCRKRDLKWIIIAEEN